MIDVRNFFRALNVFSRRLAYFMLLLHKILSKMQHAFLLKKVEGIENILKSLSEQW